MLGKYPSLEMPATVAPQLIVVIDTEEEFDWSAEPDRAANTVRHMEHISLVQDIFNEYSLKPCYVIDYPIASTEASSGTLRSILNQEQCEIGAHLHPWVNPPFDEDLSRSNMYPGNLGKELEFAKLQMLTRTIEANLGTSPRAYKAGRYGVSQHTPEIMKSLGYDIDLSICTAFDYRDDGGPDFSDYDAKPYWFGSNQEMLEIPLSGAFVGFAGRASKHLYNIAGRLNRFKARGILSRLNVVDRLMLSPEGYDFDEHVKLTRFLYNQGVRTFTWNFHSPTVVPGMTMYTQSDSDVSKFLDKFRRYFDFFFEQMNGLPSTPTLIKAQLENQP